MPIIANKKPEENIKQNPSSFSNISTVSQTQRTQFKPSFRKPILEYQYRTITFTSPRLAEKITIENGINLFYGDPETGKTSSCMNLAFNALEKGMKVIYYDTERGVHPDRIIQIYKSNNWTFDYNLLYKTFVYPEKLDWKKLFDDVSRIISLEKPDMLVIDSFTPVFMKDFTDPSKQYEKWLITNERENLVYRLFESAYDNKIIVIIVCHAKQVSKKKEDVERQMKTLASEPELFAGVGRRFEYLAKLWLYFMKVIDEQGDMKRYMVITRRKVGENFYESKEKIEFKISNIGVE